jgi:hypothetical protein
MMAPETPDRGPWLVTWEGCPEAEAVLAEPFTFDEVLDRLGEIMHTRALRCITNSTAGRAGWLRAIRCKRTPFGIQPCKD